MALTEEDREMLIGCIENEGFDYAFICYSHFPEVEDEEFHRLRKEYIASQRQLEEYIGLE